MASGARELPIEDWYRVLFEGDCMQVMELLQAHPSLLKEGRSEELSRTVEGRNPDLRDERFKSSKSSPWKGRNVLHVAAWRGCVKLIQQVLNHCDLTETDGHSGVDEQGVAAVRGGGREEIAATQVVQSAQPESDGAKANDRKRNSLSRKDLGNLLSEKDGFFKLDPFAMAGFYCNVDVLVLLGYAYKKYNNPGIRRTQLSLAALGDVEDAAYSRTQLPPAALVDVNDAARKDQLRNATKEAMKALDKTALSTCIQNYSTDREFNFLPKEEYLFHFLSANVIDPPKTQGESVRKDTQAALSQVLKDIQTALWQKVSSSRNELWEFLLKLHDAQGRTPFHAAIDRGGPRTFVKLFDGKREMLRCALTTQDTASRTPAHRAAATMMSTNGLDVLLEYSESWDEVGDTCHGNDTEADPYMFPYFKTRLSGQDDYFFECLKAALKRNTAVSQGSVAYWFKRSDKPLHAAILTNSYNCVQALAKMSRDQAKNLREQTLVEKSEQERAERWAEILYSEKCDQRGDKFFSQITWQRFTDNTVIKYDAMELACLAQADVRCLIALQEGLDEGATLKKYHAKPFSRIPKEKKETVKEKKRTLKENAGTLKENEGTVNDNEETKTIILQHPWPALHLAAYTGNYKAVKFLTDDLECNAFAEDFEENTPLHHTMMVRQFRFKYCLLDFVNCERFAEWSKKAPESEDHENQIVERQGCINQVLQAGCDIFKPNKKKQVPHPQGMLSSNATFLSWWYDKQEKEYEGTQSNLNFAANAIAVVGALVATASYVGPLTPPLGYTEDPNQLQDHNIWVILFIFCDTLSFYLAVTAITLSLIPALPMPQQPMRLELQRTQKVVTAAVCVLQPAILFVFLAFGASYFAAISDSVVSSTAGGITIGTACIGGLMYLGTVFLFIMRNLACIFPDNAWVRGFYEKTSI